jgi:hypothetical protein
MPGRSSLGKMLYKNNGKYNLHEERVVVKVDPKYYIPTEVYL